MLDLAQDELLLVSGGEPGDVVTYRHIGNDCIRITRHEGRPTIYESVGKVGSIEEALGHHDA